MFKRSFFFAKQCYRMLQNLVCCRTRYGVIFAIFLLQGCFMSLGQIYDSDLLTHRIYERIGKINDNISFMSDRHMDLSKRQYYKNQTLRMFQNNGDNYINPFDSLEKSINVTYRYNGRKRIHSVKDFFSGLVNLRYHPIKVNSVNVLSSFNIDFDNDTYIVSPVSFNISDLKKHDSDIYILPCIISRNDTDCKIEAELYLLGENTVDGFELIPLITGLNGVMENEDNTR